MLTLDNSVYEDAEARQWTVFGVPGVAASGKEYLKLPHGAGQGASGFGECCAVQPSAYLSTPEDRETLMGHAGRGPLQAEHGL